jgi:hypothetical protein
VLSDRLCGYRIGVECHAIRFVHEAQSTEHRGERLGGRGVVPQQIEVARGTRNVLLPKREKKRSLECEASALLGATQPIEKPLVDVSNQQTLEAVVFSCAMRSRRARTEAPTFFSAMRAPRGTA